MDYTQIKVNVDERVGVTGIALPVDGGFTAI